MAQARIARRAPVACAGCRGQYPDLVHIDFNSALEGPLVDETKPRGARIDWVVMCERCVRRAYELLPEAANAREALKEEVGRHQSAFMAAQEYARSLEDALAARTRAEREYVHPAVTPAPKPAAPRKGRYEPKGKS